MDLMTASTMLMKYIVVRMCIMSDLPGDQQGICVYIVANIGTYINSPKKLSPHQEKTALLQKRKAEK